MILAVSQVPDYAFSHSARDESRRLQLLEQRLDPLTKQRIQRLGVGNSARCLEIGGGRGSITRWLSDVVGPTGRVIATDLQVGFLSDIDASNVEVIRHDVRTDTFPPGSFDLIHTRAVLMHISPSADLLRRIVTWLAPGGWLVLEEPDFGMWIGDADPVWATSPPSTHAAFPSMADPCSARFTSSAWRMSVPTPRSTYPGRTDLAEFYRCPRPLSPFRRCKPARSASTRRRRSSTGPATMTSWRAGSSISVYGVGGPRRNDPEPAHTPFGSISSPGARRVSQTVSVSSRNASATWWRTRTSASSLQTSPMTSSGCTSTAARAW